MHYFYSIIVKRVVKCEWKHKYIIRVKVGRFCSVPETINYIEIYMHSSEINGWMNAE